MDNIDILKDFINKLFNIGLNKYEINKLINDEFGYFKNNYTEQDILSSITNSYIYNNLTLENDILEINKNIKKTKILKEHKKINDELKEYYLKLNYSMLEDIIEFKRSEFYKKVIENAKDLLFLKKINNHWFDKTYNYGMLKIYCNPNRDRAILAMFQYIKENQYNELENIKNTNLAEYIEELDSIIYTDSKLERILDIVNNNHILNKRLNIFKQIIEFFKEQNWELVINLLSIQIEGIFFDYTRLKEMNEIKKPNGSLKVKINTIDNTYYKYILTPYFMYDFDGIRNTIAHDGIMVFKNIEKVAKELIIICENLLNIFGAFFLPYNNLIFLCDLIIKDDKYDNMESKIINTLNVFNSILNKDKETNVYKLLINLKDYEDVFETYTLTNGETAYNYAKKILNVLESEEFWSMLYTDIKDYSECEEENIKFLEDLTKSFANVFKKDSMQKKDIENILKKLNELKKV